MSDELDRIEAVLERTSMRLGARATIAGAWRAACVMSGFALIAATLQRIAGNPVTWLPLLSFAIFCVFAWALLQWATRRPGPLVTADWIDSATSNRERMTTGLGLASQSEVTSVQSLALKDCMAWVEKFQPSQLVPLRFPRQLPWLVAPWVSILLLTLTAGPPPAAPPTTDSAALLMHANVLDDLAKSTGAPELEAAAEEIRAAEPDQRQREILKQLGLLEDQLRESRRPALSEAALNALAEALGDQRRKDLFQDAISEKLQQTELSDALEELLKALTPEQKQALRELALSAERAGAQMSEEEQQSILDQMHQAMQRSDQMAAVRDAIRQLAQQLQQPANTARRSPSANQSPPPTLEELLEMLERMKQAARDGDAPDQSGIPRPGDAPQNGDLAAQISSGGEGSGQPAADGSAGDSPSGDNVDLLPDEGPAERVTGALADGDIAREMIPAAATGDRAQRQTTPGAEPAPADTEAAMIPETIPVGSRKMIQRYFEIMRGVDE